MKKSLLSALIAGLYLPVTGEMVFINDDIQIINAISREGTDMVRRFRQRVQGDLDRPFRTFAKILFQCMPHGGQISKPGLVKAVQIEFE